jgi:hypothetical protein
MQSAIRCVRRQNRVTQPAVFDQPTGQLIRRWALAKDRCRPKAALRNEAHNGQKLTVDKAET